MVALIQKASEKSLDLPEGKQLVEFLTGLLRDIKTLGNTSSTMIRDSILVGDDETLSYSTTYFFPFSPPVKLEQVLIQSKEK